MDYAKIMKFLTSKGEEQEKALDELNQEEVEFVLVSILLTFSPEQMDEFVAGAREIITQYTPKN